MVLFSGGLKPPLFVSYFSGQTRKKPACHSMIGTFKFSACFLCCISLTFVLYYIIHVSPTLQTNALVQLVADVYYRYWDLGSIPRSPYIFHNFFFNLFPCSVPFSDLPCTQRLSLPHVQQHQSKGQNGRTTLDASQSFYT